ncbi:MAG: cytochrome c biogenesis protein CcdA [Candidatus Omnitrophica bacterium]|nr:cytochrome c biogenesis protein CcdA [Candidatus Omnitrophota bacterium]MCM8802206.1 cytochrome c biogenesis protein CcdA [Candidatus Omnitrophota bacterium]
MIENYSILLSFIGGVGSFFSPCVLPLIPIYISYITGYSIEELKEGQNLSYKKILISSLFFIIGFTIIFTSLGASSTFIGNFIGTKKIIFRFIGGAIMIIFGLHILGILKIKKLYQEKRIRIKKFNYRYMSAFFLGIALAGAWTPCVGPVLSSILILASMEKTIKRGIILLFFYSLGIGIPFIIISIFLKNTILFLNKIKKHFRKIEIFMGLLLIFLGIFLIISTK